MGLKGKGARRLMAWRMVGLITAGPTRCASPPSAVHSYRAEPPTLHRPTNSAIEPELVDSKLPPREREVHLVHDNYGTHKSPKVIRWFARHPRYHLHFTPTSGSWVNQVERWFAGITEQRIRRGSFPSIQSLEKAIREYLDHNNEHPTPFVWTADADLILGKIQRLCERTSNSGH
jgi:transposase